MDYFAYAPLFEPEWASQSPSTSDEYRPKRRGSRTSGPVTCQVDGCLHPLTTPYTKKCRVCVEHSKWSSVLVDGEMQRFCQKCSRFHPVGLFESSRRSCRKSLRSHNSKQRIAREIRREQEQEELKCAFKKSNGTSMAPRRRKSTKSASPAAASAMLPVSPESSMPPANTPPPPSSESLDRMPQQLHMYQEQSPSKELPIFNHEYEEFLAIVSAAPPFQSPPFYYEPMPYNRDLPPSSASNPQMLQNAPNSNMWCAQQKLNEAEEALLGALSSSVPSSNMSRELSTPPTSGEIEPNNETKWIEVLDFINQLAELDCGHITNPNPNSTMPVIELPQQQDRH